MPWERRPWGQHQDFNYYDGTASKNKNKIKIKHNIFLIFSYSQFSWNNYIFLNAICLFQYIGEDRPILLIILISQSYHNGLFLTVFLFIYLFILNLSRWPWFTKPYRFQVYNSIKQHLHTALWAHCLKQNLFPFPLSPPLPDSTQPPPLFSLAVTTLLSVSMGYACIFLG